MGLLKHIGLTLILIAYTIWLDPGHVEGRRGGHGGGRGGQSTRRNSRNLQHGARVRPRIPEQYYPPISGQRVRLNGLSNRTKSSGNVEVFLRNKWGPVCDDEWTMKEANVVCKQLGYTGGALSFTHQSHFGTDMWNSSDYLMDDVDCSGNEKSITNCRYQSFSNCHAGEGAGVECRPNTGCPANWLAGPDGCYFLSKLPTTRKEFAASKCQKMGGYLANIETEEENHFISNAFINDVGEPILTGALKKNDHWLWEKVLRYQPDAVMPPAPDPTPVKVDIVDHFADVLVNYLKTQLSGRRSKRSPRRGASRYSRRANTRRSSVRYASRNSNREIGRNADVHTVVNSEIRTQNSIQIFKWFPGWVPGNKGKLPTNKKNTKCIYLKNRFPHPIKSVGDMDVGYLFWEDDVCKRTKKKLKNGFRFLCERPIYIEDADNAVEAGVDGGGGENRGEHSGPKKKVDCYVGNGVTYRGKHSSTEKGTPCIPWSIATRNEAPHKRINLNHNYCRNPDNDTKPWCYVNEELHYGFCPIRNCSAAEVTTTRAPTTVPSILECPDTEFYCRNTNKCISKAWHCDMEADCDGGEDEQDCDYHILQFKKLSSSTLDKSVIKETFTRISNETCAKYCLSREDFVCRSFSYKREGRVCSLSETNTQLSGKPNQSFDTNVFELLSQTLDCKGLYTCKNGRCIKPGLVCNHHDDCGDFSDETSCWQDEPIEVRLVDGGETSGRVEVKYLGQWGTVCDDQWDASDASVVCKMLGYTSGTAKATSNAKYGQGNGKFFLDEVECIGTEVSIADCKHAGWKQHNCNPHETAGVECETRKSCTKEEFTCSTGQCLGASSVCDGICDCRPDCTDENGYDEFNCESINIEVPGVVNPDDGSVSGRIELVMNGLRGTVCDEGWDNNDATVLCKTLGYPYGKALNGHIVEDGVGPVWLDKVDCTGRESSLLRCELGPWGVNNCDHAQDAGVRCSKQPLPEDPLVDSPESLRIELVEGRSEKEGRVEVIRDGTRGTICDDAWDTGDATVVCRMLGYSGGRAMVGAHFGPGLSSLPILLDDVECTGDERSLMDCTHPGWGVNDCGHGEDAGVICSNDVDGDDGGNPDRNDALKPSVPCGRRPLELNSRKKRQEPDFDSIRELAEAPKLARIIGGYTSSRGFYPWQVGVRRHIGYGMYTHWCGGTIIHDNWIVSAAHCFQDMHKGQIRVRTGDHDNKVQDTYEQEFEAEMIINHEQFDEDSLDNDIALIKVKPGIRFSDHVQPACLPEPTTSYNTDQKCHVSGWGRTENGLQNMLKAAKVPFISDETCKRSYFSKVTPQMVCAGYLEGGIDTCAGDSGGPLVCQFNGRYTLMGATSFGAECARANAPGVYARITSFLPWIREKIRRYS